MAFEAVENRAQDGDDGIEDGNKSGSNRYLPRLVDAVNREPPSDYDSERESPRDETLLVFLYRADVNLRPSRSRRFLRFCVWG